jgi:GNAT superfamily N-acetyltransferase
MITATRPRLPSGVLAGGLQSHDRSLLVWPERLDPKAVRMLRGVVALGARVVAFAPPSVTGDLPFWPGVPCTTPYAIYRRPAEAGGAEWLLGADDPCDCERCEAGVQSLQRAGGLTPLPASVLRDTTGWRHAVVGERHVPVAVASAQLLAWPVLAAGADTVRLVAAVAVNPARRRAGLGREVVDRIVCGSHSAVALVGVDDRPARRFFEASGWEHHGALATYARWE